MTTDEIKDKALEDTVKALTGFFAILRGKSYARDHYQIEISHGLYNELRDVRDQALRALRSHSSS